jgi:hypothetical protein
MPPMFLEEDTSLSQMWKITPLFLGPPHLPVKKEKRSTSFRKTDVSGNQVLSKR